MRIAVIGTGNVGQALGRALIAKGHNVAFGTRNPDEFRSRTSDWPAPSRAARPAEAAANADIVILALPWHVAEAAVRDLGDLTGKIVIDCMNPLAMGLQGLELAQGHRTSGGEMVQAWLPGAHVVKTLNQVGAEVLADTSGFAVRPVQFIAGDVAAAKAAVARLLTDLGFQPLDAGSLAKARLLEPFALLWINQSAARGHGRNWAFAAVPRNASTTNA